MREILIFGFVLIPFVVNRGIQDEYEFSLDEDIPPAGSFAANYAAHSVSALRWVR